MQAVTVYNDVWVLAITEAIANEYKLAETIIYPASMIFYCILLQLIDCRLLLYS